MKGLLLKDYYCMKSNLKSFLWLTIGVIVLGVMFAISIHHGNIADVATSLVVEEGMTETGVYDLFRVGVWLVIIIPMAYVGNVVDCFQADYSASFGKQLFSMPVTSRQIVGARYLGCLLYAMLSFMGSNLAAICVSCATNQYPLSELMMVCATFGGLLISYFSIVMLLLYLLGTKYMDMIVSMPILATAIVGIVYIDLKMRNMSGGEEYAFLSGIMMSVKGFFAQYTGNVCAISVVLLLVSFVVSVKIVEKRRAKSIC